MILTMFDNLAMPSGQKEEDFIQTIELQGPQINLKIHIRETKH